MKRTVINQWVILAIAAMSTQVLAQEQTPVKAPVLQCYPTLTIPAAVSGLDKSDNRLRIDSDHAEILDNQTANFSGNVTLSFADTLLTAPNAHFSNAQQSMSADGGISYYNSMLKVSSSSFSAKMAENKVLLTDAEYRFLTQAGRGYASQLTASDRQVQLNQASFTTCPEGDKGWAITAEKIQINADDGWGEAWNSVIRIQDIPVLYLPYMTYPVSNKRKTGLLFPKIGSSQKLGLDIELPYYFNLAENYDLTLSPRYMSERGTQLKSEFRYLTAEHRGTLHLEYLNKDQEKPTTFGSRYLANFQHLADFNSRWRASVDFTDVSDDAYLTELGSDINNQSDTQLYRQAGLSYYGDAVRSELRLQGFETLGNYQSSYAALPQFDLKAAKPIPIGAGLEFLWSGQYAHFENDQQLIQSADRLHLEPSIRLPYYTSAMELMFESSLLQTYYQQDIKSQQPNPQLQTIDDSVQRSIPKVRFNGKLNFERDTDWFKQPYLQTLEPQVQYLYIPYRDQNNIGLFDTTRLQDDYYGLFRENRYSGLDRINDANQLTIGWTTRLYDQQDTERFRFSMGQILFLSDPKPAEQRLAQPISATESIFAAETLLHWQQRWYLNSGLQYDAKTNRMVKSSVTLDYRADDKKVLQLNHRYSRDVSDNEIVQLGALGTLPITAQWQAVASYYRDIEHDRMIEANIGFQYESCCWAIRLVARRQIETNLDVAINNLNYPVKLDSGIALQFVLKGFGDSAGFDVSDMLSSGIFGYRRPYLLNN
jgi:LPS-assembly protein